MRLKSKLALACAFATFGFATPTLAQEAGDKPKIGFEMSAF